MQRLRLERLNFVARRASGDAQRLLLVLPGWHHFEFEDTDNGVYGAERPGLDSAGSTSWYGVIGVEGKFHILEDIAPR
jgi:hypothetical protein